VKVGASLAKDASLQVRLTWLTALRLAVLSAFLSVTGWAYTGSFAWSGMTGRVALATVAAAFLVAAVYALFLRSGRALSAVAYAQLLTDQITWTAIVYVTGGATSGATSLYGLTCLSGAILLGVRGAVTAASFGAACFLGLGAALSTQVILPPSDVLGGYPTEWSAVAYPVLVNLLGMGVVTLLAGYLAARLRRAGGELEVATKRAEEAERLAALGQLAAGLAHEIRNPLGSIRGSIELLRTADGLSEEDRRLCEIIERETARLNDLIGDLLDLARPRPPELLPVDIAMTARDVVTLAGKSGRGGDVGVRYEGPLMAPVLADPAQMRQLVWNLVRNAVQASSAGDEVVVRIRNPSAEVLALEIQDHGTGIAPEAKERLFDAFFSTRSHGVGIGLAVVKRIVDDHGFAVEVDSSAGLGTTFRILIPAREAPPESAARGKAEEVALRPGI
jgi:two-component system sensor histidine kinase HydH